MIKPLYLLLQMKLVPVNKQEFTQKTKAFFRSRKWRDLLVFLIFVALAFCFWLLQYFQQKIEREISIPIYYTHVPDEIILNDSLPTEMTFHIADRGIVFLRHFLNNNFTNFNIDLKHLSLDEQSYTVDNAHLQAQLLSLLPATTQLISFQPEKIQIRYSPLNKKEVPVRINGILTPAAGYVFSDSIHIEPATVKVYGVKKALDTLQWIQTAAVQEENIRKPLDMTLKLNIPSGVRSSVQKVKVSAKVEEYTEKKFELPVLCHHLPENTHVRFFPSTVEVICRVALDKYAALEGKDLEVSVDYRELTQHQGINASPELTRKPQWLIDYRITPETVEYLIERNREL